eukprot:TRINITY_DN3036_c0_g2_i2.p1 TRINITY_DN3036_c0_g2~~TRINITY_DN3036_c0_g2_i2.p1  ORF type:complete len:760 (+),score=155.58 TRINITY_DN3036_c0_g2_i2:1255-3534(+)
MLYGGVPAPPPSARGPRVPALLAGSIQEPRSARRCPQVTLKSISQSGARANRVAEETERETDRLLSGATDVRDRLAAATAGGGQGGNAGGQGVGPGAGAGGDRGGPGDIASVVQEFTHLVAGIEGLLSGGVQAHGAMKTVKSGKEVENEKVELHAQQHYRIPLPTRPSQVIVALHRISGVAPSMWASTFCDRPHAKNYEFRGKEDRIVYDHVLLGDEAAELGEVVPRCRDLYISVEGEVGEAVYRLAVSFRPVKVSSHNRDRGKDAARNKESWQARLRELQGDVGKLESFEEHIHRLQEVRAARKHAGEDILERNARSAAANSSPSQRLARLQKESLRRAANQEAVQSRRQVIFESKANANAEWLGRPEQRRRLREEQEEQMRLEQQLRDTQMRWLEHLAVVAWAENLKSQALAAREARSLVEKQFGACCTIQRVFCRNVSRKRRHALYANVARFRVGLAAFARCMKPAVATKAQVVTKGFLEQHAFHRESPNLEGVLKRFRSNVIKIQRFWRQIKMIRQAYSEMLLPHWRANETAVCDAAIQHERDAERARTAAADQLRNAAKGHLAKLEKSKTASSTLQKPTGPGAARLSTKDARDDDAVRQAFLPPRWIIVKSLQDYIRSMQRTYKDRRAKWREQIAAKRQSADLAGFGVVAESESADDSQVQTKAAIRVYLDVAELQEIMKNTFLRYKKGAYKGLLANRRRIMKRFFAPWVRQYRRSCMGIREDRKEEVSAQHSVAAHAATEFERLGAAARDDKS